MLVRITWLLVVAAAGTLIGGFFTPDSNALLFVAIGLALSVIVLVVVSWARRAREASSYAFDGDLAYSDEEEESDEELFAALEDDEEFAVGGPRRSRPAGRRPSTRKTGRRPAKSKPKAKAKAKSRGTSARKSQSKAKAKGTGKPKAARKAKPKSGGSNATGPKSKPQRRRPSSEPESAPE